MLNLSELVFKVNTEALVDAANKVAALGKSVDGLSSTFSKLEKSSSQASKAQAKAEKDLAAAEVDRAKAADIAAKTEERKSKAVRDTAKATEEATEATKKSVSILERQRDINAFVAQGFTQGQASTMASAKAAGALADELRELGAVMKNTRSLIGGNPFDKSLNGLEALRNEYQVLTRVQTMMVQGLNLTQQQMKELALDEIRLTAAMKAQGKSAQETATAIAKLNRDYLTTAGNVNAVVRAEQELTNMQREAASASAFLEKEMQRVNFALQAQNNELNKGTANALNRFEQNLKRSGLTLDQQRVKMEEYRKGLLALEKTKGGNTDYITRALGPQITDIFVGLATGQSPLTVMLQQGGQLRDQFALAGVAADEMGAKMRTAAKDMVVSVAAVARAFGDLLIGAFIDAGKGVVNFVSQIALVDKVTEGAKRRLAAMGDEGFAYIGKLEKFAGVIAAGIGITLAATIAAVVALGVALKQVTTEQNELAKSLNLTGAALGMSSKEVVAFAQGLDSVKTSAAIEFINELSKAGVRTSKDIAGLTEVAIDLEKYGGVALKETAKAYDDLQKKPFEALMKIAEGTGQVSQKTIDMAVEMKLAGDEVGLLNLAQKEFVRANKAAVESIKAEINPMTALWITIKDGITFAWEGLKNFARTGVVLEGVVKVLNTILTGVLAITTATRFAGKTLGGYLAIMGQVADGINPFSGVSASEALKNIQGIFSEYKADVKNLGAETSAAYDQIWNGVKTTTGLTDKAREANSSYATDTLKGMSDLEKSYKSIEKAELKKITRQEAINKALEDYKQKNKQASDYQLKLIEQGAGIEWDKANKKKKDPSENYFAALMRDATNATIKADGAVQDLTKSEIKLREVQADPRFKALSKDEQDRITRIYETAAATERVTAAEDLKNKLLGKAAGLGKEYYDTLEIIENYHKRGIYSDAEVKQLTDALYKATPAYKENVKAVEELNNKLFKFREESLAIRQQLDEENRGLDLRVSLLGKTGKEQAVISREYERQAKLAKVSFDLEKRKRDIEKEWAGNAVKIWELELAAEQDAAEQRKAINRSVAVAFAEDIQREIDQVRNGITDSIVTALFEGGKAGAKKFREVIVNVLRQKVTIVVDAVVNTLLGNVIGSLLGGGGGAGGAISAGSNALGTISNAGSFINLITSGVAGTVGKVVGTLFGQTAGNAAIASSLGLGASSASAAASGASVAAGGTGAGAGLGASIGTAIPYVAIAAIVAASWKKLFGRELKDTGIQGTFGGERGFEGQSYRFYKGGLFRSDKTELSPLDEAMRKTLADAFTTMKTQVIDSAKVLGLNADKFKDFTTSIKISLNGLSEQDANAKIQEALTTVNNEMAQEILGTWKETSRDVTRTFNTGTGENDFGQQTVTETIKERTYVESEYAKEGEKAIDTLTRLATSLGTVNKVFDTLGYTAYEASLKGGDMASKLADLFGGLDQFIASTTFYYQNFYTEVERQQTAVRQLEAEFKKNNITLPKTRDEYRKLVESQDLTTEAGRKMYALLLQLAPAFDVVADSVEETIAMVQSTSRDIQDRILEQQAKYYDAVGNTTAAAAARQKQLEIQRWREYYKYMDAGHPELARLAIELWQLEDATNAAIQAQEALQKARDTAMKALEAAIAREKKVLEGQRSVLNETISNLTSIFETIRTNVADLYNEVLSTSMMQASAGNSFISQAVANAIATGAMPDSKELAEAITAARGGLSNSNFGSQFEADRARLLLAGQLSIIGKVAGDQKTTAEKQLDAINDQIDQLDKTLEYWKEQIAIATGTFEATLSVAQAITALQATLNGIVNPPSVPPTPVPPVPSNPSPSPNPSGGGGAVFGGTSPGTAGPAFTYTVDANGLQTYSDGSSHQMTPDEFYVYKLWMAGINPAAGHAGIPADARVSIPAFASGGMHSGGMRLVGENGPELEVTGPSRIFNSTQTASMLSGGSDDSESAAEIRALREENRAQARAMVQLQTKLTKIIERWDGAGMPEVRLL